MEEAEEDEKPDGTLLSIGGDDVVARYCIMECSCIDVFFIQRCLAWPVKMLNISKCYNVTMNSRVRFFWIQMSPS